MEFSGSVKHIRLSAALIYDFYCAACMECRGGLAMRILSVRLSVRLQKRVNCDKTEEKSVRILYHTKDHLAF